MHKTQVQIYIWDGDCLANSSNWMVAYKEMEIPFIPFIGLQINFPMEKPRKVESVGWNVEGNTFSCTLEPQFCEFGVGEPMFDEWKETFEDNEWRLEGPHPKNI